MDAHMLPRNNRPLPSSHVDQCCPLGLRGASARRGSREKKHVFVFFPVIGQGGLNRLVSRIFSKVLVRRAPNHTRKSDSTDLLWPVCGR